MNEYTRLISWIMVFIAGEHKVFYRPLLNVKSCSIRMIPHRRWKLSTLYQWKWFKIKSFAMLLCFFLFSLHLVSFCLPLSFSLHHKTVSSKYCVLFLRVLAVYIQRGRASERDWENTRMERMSIASEMSKMRVCVFPRLFNMTWLVFGHGYICVWFYVSVEVMVCFSLTHTHWLSTDHVFIYEILN